MFSKKFMLGLQNTDPATEELNALQMIDELDIGEINPKLLDRIHKRLEARVEYMKRQKAA
jgi:hypothetical protein